MLTAPAGCRQYNIAKDRAGALDRSLNCLKLAGASLWLGLDAPEIADLVELGNKRSLASAGGGFL